MIQDNSFDLDIMGRVPHMGGGVILRRKHTGPLQKVSLYRYTCHCPLVAISLIAVYKKPKLKSMHATDQINQNKKKLTCMYKTQLPFSPVYFERFDFPLRCHCQGQSQSRESTTVVKV
jgi:hypothetical protein